MGEKIYKSMKAAGIWNIAIGIVLIVVCVGAGILTIINGARLLKDKSDVMF